jgi:hypothetical protein
MADFTRGFRLHHNGHILDGAAFPSGRAFVLDDPEYGFATGATSLEELLKGYHGARIEWATADRAAVYAEVADRLAADAEQGAKEGFTRIYRRSAAKQVREWGEELAAEAQQDGAQDRG